MSLNSVNIMGRLARDPELRRTGSGIAVCSFTLAVDRDFGEKGKEKGVDFIDFTAWRQTAEFVSKYFTKGRMMVVSGRLEVRDWTDKDGNKRKSVEVVAENCYFGDSKKEDGGANAYGGNTGYGGGYGGSYGGGYATPPAPAQGQQYSQPQGQPQYSQPQGQPQYGQPQGQQQGFNAPAPAPAQGQQAPQQQGGFSGYGGYSGPAAPASDFAMLNDEDAQLPF